MTKKRTSKKRTSKNTRPAESDAMRTISAAQLEADNGLFHVREASKRGLEGIMLALGLDNSDIQYGSSIQTGYPENVILERLSALIAASSADPSEIRRLRSMVASLRHDLKPLIAMCDE